MDKKIKELIKIYKNEIDIINAMIENTEDKKTINELKHDLNINIKAIIELTYSQV